MNARRQPSPRKTPPAWIGVAALGGAFAALLWLEHRRPMRPDPEPKLRRTARNLGLAALAAVAVQVAEKPLTAPLTRLVERRRIGLLQRLGMPRWLRTALTVVLLDYTLYVWHVLTHKMPLLWRFHGAHHADLGLDASTGIRFHFGEMALSALWRAAQVLVIGVSSSALSVWNTLMLVEVMFHHSNVAVPATMERWLSKLIVTPRMHAIHHSVVPEETDSNWSSGLAIWDYLHGTLRRDVPQGAIEIGLPAYRDPAQVTLPKVIAMPFGPQQASGPPDSPRGG